MSLFEASLPLPLPLPLSSSVSLNLVKNGIFSIYSQCYLLPLHLRLSPLLLSYHRSPCLVSAQKSPENNSQQKHSFTFCIYIIYNIDLSVKLKKSKRQRDCAWLCGDGVVKTKTMYIIRIGCVYSFWVKRYLWHRILSNFRNIFHIHRAVSPNPFPTLLNLALLLHFIRNLSHTKTLNPSTSHFNFKIWVSLMMCV